MKSRNRYLWICIFMVLCALGKTVNAQGHQNTNAQEIIKQCKTVMTAKKVLALKFYMTYEGQTETFMEMAEDDNTKVSYIEMLGERIYLDGSNQLIYMYDSAKKCWYVSDAGDSDITFKADNKDYLIFDMDHAVITYEYEGIETYRNISCEKVTAHVKDDTGEIYDITYYIKTGTYELWGEVVQQEGLIIEICCFYPDSVQIPANVTSSAVLAPGDSIRSGKLQYTVPQSAKGRVLQVSNGSKAKGKVTIPDTVTFAGKSYKVTGIADKAFANNRKITKVTLGKNIKTIGKRSFYKCKKLKQVVIRSTKINKIGQRAFYGNAKKLKVKVPKSKLKKYKGLLKKSKISSKLTVSK